jgi:hypothetical protein
MKKLFLFSLLALLFISVISAITFQNIFPTTNPFITNQSTVNLSYGIHAEDGLSSITHSWNGSNTTIFNSEVLSFWSFDNNSKLGEVNNVVDNMNIHNGTINSALWVSSGKYGGAFNFTGQRTSNITVPHYGLLNVNLNTSEQLPHSYSLWFKTDNTSQTQYLISLGTTNRWQFRLTLNGTGSPSFTYYENNGDVVCQDNAFYANLRDNNWHNIVVTMNITGLYCKIYVDSVPKSSSLRYMTHNLTSLNYTDPLIIGGGRQDSGASFVGLIDDVIIFSNRTLSANEISYLYNLSIRKSNSTFYEYNISNLNSTSVYGMSSFLCGENTTGDEFCTSTFLIRNKHDINVNFSNSLKTIPDSFYGVNYQTGQGLYSGDEEDSDKDCTNDRDVNYLFNRNSFLSSGLKSFRWTIYLENSVYENLSTFYMTEDRELIKWAYDNNLTVQLIASRMPLWLANTSSPYCTQFYNCPAKDGNYTKYGNAVLAYLNDVTNNGEYISAIDSIEVFNEPDIEFLDNISNDNETMALEYVDMFNETYNVLNASYPELTIYGLSSTSTVTYPSFVNTFLSNLSTLINNTENIGLSLHSYWRYLYAYPSKVQNETSYLLSRCSTYNINCTKISISEWNMNIDDHISFTNTHAGGNARTFTDILNLPNEINMYLYKWGASTNNASCQSNYNFSMYEGITPTYSNIYNVTKNFAHLCPAGASVYVTSNDDSTIKQVSCKKGNMYSLIVINTDTNPKNITLNMSLTNGSVWYPYKTLKNYNGYETYSITSGGISQLGILDSYGIFYLTSGIENQTALFNFDENTGDTLYDKLGITASGTKSGGTWKNDGVLLTLTNAVDYTINVLSGLFSIVNTDYVYSYITATWKEGYTTNTITGLKGNLSAGVDKISTKVPVLFLVLIIAVIMGVLALLVIAFSALMKKSSGFGFLKGGI